MVALGLLFVYLFQVTEIQFYLSLFFLAQAQHDKVLQWWHQDWLSLAVFSSTYLATHLSLFLGYTSLSTSLRVGLFSPALEGSFHMVAWGSQLVVKSMGTMVHPHGELKFQLCLEEYRFLFSLHHPYSRLFSLRGKWLIFHCQKIRKKNLFVHKEILFINSCHFWARIL